MPISLGSCPTLPAFLLIAALTSALSLPSGLTSESALASPQHQLPTLIRATLEVGTAMIHPQRIAQFSVTIFLLVLLYCSGYLHRCESAVNVELVALTQTDVAGVAASGEAAPRTLILMGDSRGFAPASNTSSPGYHQLAASINYHYAQRHGYDFRFLLFPCLDASANSKNCAACVHPVHGPRSSPWCKVQAIQEILLADPRAHRYDWVVFLDSDAIVKDMETPVSHFTQNNTNQSLGLFFNYPVQYTAAPSKPLPKLHQTQTQPNTHHPNSGRKFESARVCSCGRTHPRHCVL
jgi:hypothetical protein